MTTSSITHNFVVSKPNSVKCFVATIDEADRDRTPKQTLPGRQLTNPQGILALMSKRKKHNPIPQQLVHKMILFLQKIQTHTWNSLHLNRKFLYKFFVHFFVRRVTYNFFS